MGNSMGKGDTRESKMLPASLYMFPTSQPGPAWQPALHNLPYFSSLETARGEMGKQKVEAEEGSLPRGWQGKKEAGKGERI